MSMDRIDATNLFRFVNGMARGLDQMITLLDGGDKDDLDRARSGLLDYYGQHIAVAEALYLSVADDKPLDWNALDDQIGTEVTRPSEMLEGIG